MNQTAILRTKSFEIPRAGAFKHEAKKEKAFTKQAFIAITLVFASAWFLTGL